MRDEAFVLDHDHTGTEHLLLAIVKVNDDLTAPVLRRFGVSEAGLHQEVQKIVTPDLDPDAAGAGQSSITRPPLRMAVRSSNPSPPTIGPPHDTSRPGC